MTFTLRFFEELARYLFLAAPILLALLSIIIALSLFIGRKEQWSLGNSLYFGLITATTVGYGDFRPSHRRGKVLAILIAFLGLMMTGIFVAIAVEAAGQAFDKTFPHMTPLQ